MYRDALERQARVGFRKDVGKGSSDLATPGRGLFSRGSRRKDRFSSFLVGLVGVYQVLREETEEETPFPPFWQRKMALLLPQKPKIFLGISEEKTQRSIAYHQKKTRSNDRIGPRTKNLQSNSTKQS